MKLATWNVERPTQPRRRSALRSYIDRADADVWVLTETHDDLVLELPHVHSSTPGRDDGINQQERWVSIWSRYPIQALSCSDPIRTAAALVTPSDGDPFIVFGSVLPWIGSAWRTHPSAGGAAFREAVACQLDDWRRFRRELPDAAFFVLGDLNQDLAGSHYYGSRANRAVLEAALNEVGLTAVTGGSADPVRRNARPRALIDHICALKDSAWTPNEPVHWPDTPTPPHALSDHFGVAVQFNTPVRNRGV